MKATKSWGFCSCGCGKAITAGESFVIYRAEFFLMGHESGKIFAPEVPEPKPDFSRVSLKPIVQQQPILDLPLFDTESQKVQQLSLF